jgi:hypothetical protein
MFSLKVVLPFPAAVRTAQLFFRLCALATPVYAAPVPTSVRYAQFQRANGKLGAIGY